MALTTPAALLLALFAQEGRVLLLSPGFEFRAATGPEYDTNARRAIDFGPLASGDVVADGLVRFTLDAEADIALTNRDSLRLTYLLGAKRFFQETTEDLFTHDLQLSTSHHFGEHLSLRVWTQGKLNRMRSGARNYNYGVAEGSVAVHFSRNFTLSAKGRAIGYDFPPFSDFSYSGPGVAGQFTYRHDRRLSFNAFVEHDWRMYQGNARVFIQQDPDGAGPLGAQDMVWLTDCSDPDAPTNSIPGAEWTRIQAQFPDATYSCAEQRRDDDVLFTGIGGAYRGAFIVGGRFGARLQRSTSVDVDFDRFQLSAYATVPLPLRFVLHLNGLLVFSRGIGDVTTITEAEADENQNRLDVGLTFRATDALNIDARYSLFANQFQDNDVSFVRQIAYLGVSYEVSTGD